MRKPNILTIEKHDEIDKELMEQYSKLHTFKVDIMNSYAKIKRPNSLKLLNELLRANQALRHELEKQYYKEHPEELIEPRKYRSHRIV